MKSQKIPLHRLLPGITLQTEPEQGMALARCPEKGGRERL